MPCERAATDSDGGTTDPDDPQEPTLSKVLAVYLDDQELDGQSPIDFGDVVLNQTVSKSFVIKNVGEDEVSLAGGQVELNGADAAEFSLDTTATATTIAAGEETGFDLHFAPVSAGEDRAATLTVTSDADVTSFSVDIEGRGGTGAVIRANLGATTITDTVELDPTYVLPGNTEALTISVNNDGDLDLLVSGVGLTGDTGGPTDDWEFLFDPEWSTPIAISPGGTRELILKLVNRFGTNSGNAYYQTGDIAITSNSVDPPGSDVFEFSAPAYIYY